MAEPRVLVIEDLRTFRFPATYARTVYEAWPHLVSGHWDEIWFDHDMGLTRDDDTTYPIAQYMEKRAYEGVPIDVDRVFVHTANPYGGDRLMAALRAYNPIRVDANDYLVPGEDPMYWNGQLCKSCGHPDHGGEDFPCSRCGCRGRNRA